MAVGAMFVLVVREGRRDLFSLLAEVDGFFDGVLVGLYLRPPPCIFTQH